MIKSMSGLRLASMFLSFYQHEQNTGVTRLTLALYEEVFCSWSLQSGYPTSADKINLLLSSVTRIINTNKINKIHLVGFVG